MYDRTDPVYVAPHPGYIGRQGAILPFPRDLGRWSPRQPAEHPFGQQWLANTLALIIATNTGPTRLIHSSGQVPYETWRVGCSFDAYHDQHPSRFMGTYRVVGIAVYGEDGTLAAEYGDVPDRKLYLSTFK